MAAGRLGPGWLLAREERAAQSGIAARPGAVWDGRFRLAAMPAAASAALMIGALAADRVRFRGLPAAVACVLPALRRDGTLIAVPHLGFGDPAWVLLFDPRNPAAGAPFGVG